MKFNKCFWKERKEVEIDIPSGWKWLKTTPDDAHFIGQVDYTTVVRVENPDVKRLDINYVDLYQIGEFYIVQIKSVDEKPEMEEIDIVELNEMFETSYMSNLLNKEGDDFDEEIIKVHSIVSPQHICCDITSPFKIEIGNIIPIKDLCGKKYAIGNCQPISTKIGEEIFKDNAKITYEKCL